MNRIQSLKNTLGPGILFASTAIGVSHLVQSTKAGALVLWTKWDTPIAVLANKIPGPNVFFKDWIRFIFL